MATNFRNQVQRIRQHGSPTAIHTAEAFDLIQPELDALGDAVTLSLIHI